MSTDTVHLVKDPKVKRRLARGGSWDVRKSWLAQTLLMRYLGAVTAGRPVVRRLASPLALRWGFGLFWGFYFGRAFGCDGPGQFQRRLSWRT